MGSENKNITKSNVKKSVEKKVKTKKRVIVSKTKTDNKKRAVLIALENTLGVVTLACKKADVARCQFYKWCEDDKEFLSQVQSVQDIALDFAESKLFEQIKDNNPTSTIFYLKTKGKKRGYVERIENVNKEVDEFEGKDEQELKAELEFLRSKQK